MPDIPEIVPIAIETQWGLVYYIEQGRPPFEIVWSINEDEEVANLFGKAGLSPVLSNEDATTIRYATHRLPEHISDSLYIAGRSIVYPSSEPYMYLNDTPYNAIQVSGWGFNRIVDSTRGSVGVATQTVLLPRDDQNYRDIRPNATTTTIIQAGKRRQSARDYLFPGAYTESEIVKKVGSELALWNILTSNGTNWDIPFHIPLPLMIGRYKGLVDPKGRPAYFYASSVPFSGMRDGIIFDQSQENIDFLLNSTPRIASALRVLHDYGLVHNQAGMGNINTSDTHNGGKPLLADMATLTPLDLTPVRHPRTGKRIRNYGRAHDLLGVINGSLLSFNFSGTDPVSALQNSLSDVLFYYGAFNENNAYALADTLSEILRDPANLDYYMAEFLDDAEDRGILDKQPNIKQIQKHSVRELNYWENKMRQISRV